MGVGYNIKLVMRSLYIFLFHHLHRDLYLYQYRTILKKNDIDYIDYNKQSFKDADRFSEGILLCFLEEGYISKWRRRLKEIDSL